MGRDVEAYWGRDKNWFYKSNLTDQTNALYNIIDDPFCTKNVINNRDIIFTNPPLTLKLLYFSVFESKVYNFIYWFSLILRYNKAKAHCK